MTDDDPIIPESVTSLKPSAKEVYDYLREKGVPDTHAKGILSNIEEESGFDPAIHEKGQPEERGGIGLFQHTADRRKALEDAVPDWKTNWKGQADFALSEPQSQEFLKQQFKTPEEASSYFTKSWENPANANSEARERAKNTPRYAQLDKQSGMATDATVDDDPIIPESVQPINKESRLESLGKSAKGFAVGALRQLPGSDLIPAAVEGSMIDPFMKMIHGEKPDPLMKGIRQNYSLNKTVGNRMEKEAPTSALLGHLTTAIPEYMSGARALGIGGPEATFVGNVGKGALLAPAIGQGERGTKINPTATAIDAILGGGGEAISEPIQKVGGYLADHAADFARSIKIPKDLDFGIFGVKRKIEEEALKDAFKASEAAKKVNYDSGVGDLENKFSSQEAARKLEHEAGQADLGHQFDTQEAARQARYDAEKQAASELPSKISPFDKIGAGQQLSNAAEETKKALGQKYSELVDPIIKENGNQKISAQGLRSQINDVLSKEGLVDAKGNILRKQINSYDSPNLKNVYGKLADISQKLKTNPTVYQQQRILDSLSELSQFSKELPPKQQAIFRGLRTAARDDLHAGLSELAGPESRDAIEQAKAMYASQKPVLDDVLSQTRGVPVEKIVEGSKRNLRGTWLDNAITKTPQLKEPLSHVVLNDIAERGTSASKLSDIIDHYGRESLQSLLTPEQYSQLTAAEEAFKNASNPFQKAVRPEGLPFQKAIPPEKIPYKAGEQPQWEPKYLTPFARKVGKTLRGSGKLIQSAIPVSVTGTEQGFK